MLPEDSPVVDAHNARARPDHRLRLELLPEPFIGSPEAPVVILMGNPGYSSRDIEAHGDEAFRAAARANLTHAAMAFPHYLLDSAFSWTSGGQWWRLHTRAILAEVGERAASGGILVLESLPYHSVKYQAVATPSQRYTEHLLTAAVDRGALVIEGRGPWRARVPGIIDHPNLIRLRNNQRMWITPGNMEGDGFARVIAALRAHADAGGAPPT